MMSEGGREENIKSRSSFKMETIGGRQSFKLCRRHICAVQRERRQGDLAQMRDGIECMSQLELTSFLLLTDERTLLAMANRSIELALNCRPRIDHSIG